MTKSLARKETNKRKTLFRNEAMDAAVALPSDDITFEQAWIIHKLDCLGCLLHDMHNPKPTNCRDNPYCIKRLGLEKFERLIKAEKLNSAKVEESQKRRDILEVPCGLTNSGNFCYVNSFLQVWYNDPIFRQIIFDWRPSSDYVRPPPPAMDVEAVMNSLQHLFYTMQTTPFEDTDDNRHFTAALRLGNEQQDAQEFSLVLFDALDRNLAKHPHGEVIRQRIRERGLQLSGFGVHADYLCDECSRRGYVKRQTIPEKLPPVIMLQLNRYVFDANGRNRKLKTPIVYPRELSARSFHLGVSKYDDFDYELFAVMIHEGDNTFCGHYYDLVRHPFTGVWYKYNDEHVEPLSRPPGVERSKSIPGGRPTPDMKACYGLAYRVREANMPDIVMPPNEITEIWATATENKFDGQTKETIAKSEKRLNDLTLRFTQLSNLFEALETHADKYKTPKDIAFLPTKLLSDILEKEYSSIAPDNRGDIENKPADAAQEESSGEPNQLISAKRPIRASRLRTVRHKVARQLSSQEIPICYHGRLFVDSVLFGDVKAVSRTTAESLLPQYGIITKVKGENRSSEDFHPLLTGSDICVDCVKELRREGQFRDSLESHVKLATRILKDKTRCSLSRTPKPEGYLYISRKCLANFKKLALREMEHQHKLQSTGASLQFMVDLATVDNKYSANASSPRRSRVPRRKRIMTRNESEPMAMCNGCHTPSKLSKDDPIINHETADVKENVVQVERQVAEDVYLDVDNEDDEVQKKVEIMPQSVDDKAEMFACGDDMTLASSEVDDIASSSNSVESGVQQMDSCRLDSEPTSTLSYNFQDNSATELNDKRKTLSENGDVKSEKSAIVQKYCEEHDEASAAGSPHERPSCSPPENSLSSPLERPSSSASHSSTHDLGAVEFNSELRCEHGCVNLDEFRQAVSPKEWEQLSSYFDMATTFLVRCDEPICRQCEQEFNEQQSGKQELKESLRDLRGRIGELLRDIDRRRPTEEEYGTIYSRGICSKFLAKLNTTIKARSSSLVLPSICQECVLCSHGLPNVGLACDFGSVHVVALTEQEWDRLCDEVVTGVGARRISSMCESCFGKRLESLNIQRYVYEDEFIYVALSEDGALNGSFAKTTRRTQKNKCFRVKMSSTDTVKDLKVQLYKQTGQTPNDQLLYRELGGSLLDSDSTLFDARIEKNNADQPLILIAQSVSNVPTKYDEQPRAPERGFIDTALAH
ncbi:unnamed protein product [Angiostrongylus costaricensis]|uniref:ubiquitinyl hydrolase 1 n=1 Tax=Angiostrongylus costaricensis TaxID=334426 RepID=A0A158PD17_ANGCS|nr:unnamed protein product [Angiostrongylus costaricensis]